MVLDVALEAEAVEEAELEAAVAVGGTVVHQLLVAPGRLLRSSRRPQTCERRFLDAFQAPFLLP